MAFCPQCGAESAGNFCPKCGAPAQFAEAPAGGFAPPSSSASAAAASGLSENVASALCYLLGVITGIIFLVLAPYNQNRTVRFHAFQAIFFHLGAIIFWILYMMISGMLGVMTHHLSIFLTFPLSFLVGIGLFATWLYLMYSAYNGKKVILPIVGPLAEKQA